MRNVIELESLSHRSRARIKNLGEVFTPESYVEHMLDLLSKGKGNLWSDEEVTFFEPCSGHGNIVLPIYRRRLEAIYKKSFSAGNREAAYYAVANALNTLWAIDIDFKNVENCRSRVFFATLEFLKEKLNIENDSILIAKKKKFFAHLVSAIKWHISENETLSALSTSEKAKDNAYLTKVGAEWFSENGHQELDFDLTWANYFESCEAANATPIQYQRSVRFIDSVLSGKLRGFDDFDFAKEVININNEQSGRSQLAST